LPFYDFTVQNYHFSDQKCVFDHGLLDDQFTSKNHFYLLSDWSHTSTADFLLHNRTDIVAAVAGNALHRAAMARHTFIARLLLQRRTDIPADD
jgi:hypothetical protein